MLLAIMGIGLAGAGKTTKLKSLAEEYGLAYVSRDELALQYCGHPHDQSVRTEINNRADAATMAALGKGQHVVIDSTFVDKQKRCSKIQYLRLVGADRVVGVFFDVPFGTARKRNRQRKHAVPEGVIRDQFHKLTRDPPSLADGFDHLYRSSELDTLVRNELQ